MSSTKSQPVSIVSNDRRLSQNERERELLAQMGKNNPLTKQIPKDRALPKTGQGPVIDFASGAK